MTIDIHGPQITGAGTGNTENVLVLGGAGTNKKLDCIIPNLLQASGSYVITDVAGALYRSYGTFLKNKGYDVRCFNLESSHIEIPEECGRISCARWERWP